MEKITKATVLIAIESYFEESDAAEVIAYINGVDVTVADVFEYTSKTREQLANKAAKAREKQAEKKSKGDELRGAVEAVLTDKFQTIADITPQVNVEDVTPAKVTARLSQLVNAGIAEKKQVKAGEGRKVMAYRLASEEVCDDGSPVEA